MLLELIDMNPIGSSKLLAESLIVERQGFGALRCFTAQADDAGLGNTDVKEIFEKLVESVVRIAGDKNGLRSKVVEDLGEECPDKRLPST